MREGSVVLAPLPQADGRMKTRPVVLLRKFPGYGDFLVCACTSRTERAMPGLDDFILKTDDDFAQSGLDRECVICICYLGFLPAKKIAGAIGSISRERHTRLLRNLSAYLIRDLAPEDRIGPPWIEP